MIYKKTVKTEKEYRHTGVSLLFKKIGKIRKIQYINKMICTIRKIQYKNKMICTILYQKT